MPGQYSAQGTTVSFGGVTIGYITGWDWTLAAASPVETTNVTSTVVGTGASARVVKTYDVTAIEPITLSFTFKGPPSFGPSDAGKKATLAFSGGGASWTGEAILTKFNHSGRPNQYTDGAAEFQATGS